MITRNPVKTTYEIGEQFDPTGIDIIIIYEDRALSMVSIPEGYYTYAPTVITETTKEIVFSFRGFNVSLPITVNGVDSSEDTTGTPETPPEETTITPPETETDTITTQEPEVTTDPNETTEAPEVSSDPETTIAPETTNSPEDVTTDSSETTDPGDDKKDPVPLLYIWIAVIAIIVIALIALIIYYKKNFT